MAQGDQRYVRLMERARRTNLQRDAADRQAGFAPPPSLGVLQQLRTAMLAIECGIKTADWECVAEGQAMLEHLRPEVEDMPDLFTHTHDELLQKLLREVRAGTRR